MKELITSENWTHTYFKSLKLKAFISFGGDHEQEGTFLYYVTCTDHDHQEIFQTSHSLLEEALALINEKYGHWPYEDALNKDGCSSCGAH